MSSKPLRDARTPQPDVLHRGDDPREDARAERFHVLRALDGLEALVDRKTEVLPYLDLVEASAHEVASLDHELFALVALDVRELGVDLAEREPAKGDMARLVLHHVRVHGRHQRGSSHLSRMPWNAASASALDEDRCIPR